jgi:hypothetical protein
LPILFATDAEGANNQDHGGWGIVTSTPDLATIKETFEIGSQPSCTLSKLDGSFHQLKNPVKEMEARIPVSKLPPQLFEAGNQWLPVRHGRWRRTEHITLGEGRTTNILLQIMADIPEAHAHRLNSMCDNLGWCAATVKGRSPAWRVDLLLRRRAAILIATEMQCLHPWIDTLKMPADYLSRIK